MTPLRAGVLLFSERAVLNLRLKVLKVPEHSYCWYQKALVVGSFAAKAGNFDYQPSELQNIFSAAPPSPHASLGVPTSVKNHYYSAIGAEHKIAEGSGTSQEERNENEKGPRKVVSVGDDCPVSVSPYLTGHSCLIRAAAMRR